MTHFRPEIPLHKEMLAILTAITEIIDERGGKQTSTEYFVVLIETMKAAITESELVPAIALLAMGIKSVPQPVLRTQFSQVGPLLYDLMGRFINSEHKNIMRSVSSSNILYKVILKKFTNSVVGFWMYVSSPSRSRIF